MSATSPRILAAAAAIANARAGRRGAPAVDNVLDVLSGSPRLRHLHDEVLEDAREAIAAADAAREKSEAKRVAEIAIAIREPARAAEVERHHRAMLAGLNASHDGASRQDAVVVFEAVARLLATLVGGLNDDEASGSVRYVARRALHHVPAMRRDGVTADTEAPPPGERH